MMLDFEKLRQIYGIEEDFKVANIFPVIQKAKLQTFEVGEFLIKEGDTQKDVFFIIEGLIRSFKYTKGKKQTTILLKWENQFFMSHDIIFFNQPSQFYYEAIEPTKVLSLDYNQAEILMTQTPILEPKRKFILYKILQDLMKRVHSFVLLSPEERYIDFIKSHPEIINRVPDKYIANILGITPVSLSRIRSRIANQKK